MLFQGKPARIRALYDRFHEMVRQCGPAKVLPYPKKVAYMVRVRFAGAAPTARWLDVGFWLPRRVESPRFRRVETNDPNAHVHFLRITDGRQLDAELAGWLAEAYEVGCQRHCVMRSFRRRVHCGKFERLRRGSQVVRQESAKLPFAGSIPARASQGDNDVRW